MTKNSVHGGIKRFQRQVRKYLLKNRLHRLSGLKNQQRINCMIKTYDLIYHNSTYYCADLLLATFKEHLRDQLWKHYKMLLSVMWKFEIATKKRRGIPEVLTDLILDFCGPPDKYVQGFQTKWYRLLCQRINKELYFKSISIRGGWTGSPFSLSKEISSLQNDYWDLEHIHQWVTHCWLRFGWSEGYQRRNIWKDNYRDRFDLKKSKEYSLD